MEKVSRWITQGVNGRRYIPKISQFSKITQHRQHIFTDLRPYICIMEDCKFTAAFGSRKEYEQHLATHEFVTVLSCEICDNTEDDIDQLHRHYRSVHRMQSGYIVRKTKVIQRNLNNQKCPFCGEIPGSKYFVGHVCQHCEEVALSSLSYVLDEDSNSDDDSESSSIVSDISDNFVPTKVDFKNKFHDNFVDEIINSSNDDQILALPNKRFYNELN